MKVTGSCRWSIDSAERLVVRGLMESVWRCRVIQPGVCLGILMEYWRADWSRSSMHRRPSRCLHCGATRFDLSRFVLDRLHRPRRIGIVWRSVYRVRSMQGDVPRVPSSCVRLWGDRSVRRCLSIPTSVCWSLLLLRFKRCLGFGPSPIISGWCGGNARCLSIMWVMSSAWPEYGSWRPSILG